MAQVGQKAEIHIYSHKYRLIIAGKMLCDHAKEGVEFVGIGCTINMGSLMPAQFAAIAVIISYMI